jgi:hypothetical protein
MPIEFNRQMILIVLVCTDFSFDQAKSRTYRWGEDGIAGVSDTHALQCISFAFWNEKE